MNFLCSYRLTDIHTDRQVTRGHFRLRDPPFPKTPC